jgi:hypothetical protein
MSLWIKLYNNFFTHRKTVRLRKIIGQDAYWVVPRLWTYAADSQPDGCFGDYDDEEIAGAIGYNGKAAALVRALCDTGFLDAKTRKIHNWMYYNGYHATYKERAKKGAQARWKKPPLGKTENTNERKGEKITSNASSIPSELAAQDKRPERWQIKKDLENLKSRISELEQMEKIPERTETIVKLKMQKRALQKQYDEFPAEGLPIPTKPKPVTRMSSPPRDEQNSFAKTPKAILKKFVDDTLREIDGVGASVPQLS